MKPGGVLFIIRMVVAVAVEYSLSSDGRQRYIVPESQVAESVLFGSGLCPMRCPALHFSTYSFLLETRR